MGLSSNRSDQWSRTALLLSSALKINTSTAEKLPEVGKLQERIDQIMKRRQPIDPTATGGKEIAALFKASEGPTSPKKRVTISRLTESAVEPSYAKDYLIFHTVLVFAQEMAASGDPVWKKHLASLKQLNQVSVDREGNVKGPGRFTAPPAPKPNDVKTGRELTSEMLEDEVETDLKLDGMKFAKILQIDFDVFKLSQWSYIARSVRIALNGREVGEKKSWNKVTGAYKELEAEYSQAALEHEVRSAALAVARRDRLTALVSHLESLNLAPIPDHRYQSRVPDYRKSFPEIVAEQDSVRPPRETLLSAETLFVLMTEPSKGVANRHQIVRNEMLIYVGDARDMFEVQAQVRRMFDRVLRFAESKNIHALAEGNNSLLAQKLRSEGIALAKDENQAAIDFNPTKKRDIIVSFDPITQGLISGIYNLYDQRLKETSTLREIVETSKPPSGLADKAATHAQNQLKPFIEEYLEWVKVRELLLILEKTFNCLSRRHRSDQKLCELRSLFAPYLAEGSFEQVKSSLLQQISERRKTLEAWLHIFEGSENKLGTINEWCNGDKGLYRDLAGKPDIVKEQVVAELSVLQKLEEDFTKRMEYDPYTLGLGMIGAVEVSRGITPLTLWLDNSYPRPRNTQRAA